MNDHKQLITSVALLNRLFADVTVWGNKFTFFDWEFHCHFSWQIYKWKEKVTKKSKGSFLSSFSVNQK
jgi:hypothetical protein